MSNVQHTLTQAEGPTEQITEKKAKTKKTSHSTKTRKQAMPAKKARAKTKEPVKSAQHREASKKELILELLRRKEGATVAEMAQATDWQNHSVRGFLSGTISKKMALVIEPEKKEGAERTYRLLK